MKFPKTIRALNKTHPHESWRGWKNFLKSCEVRDQFRGVILFGETNCNYILLPDGLLIQNYGFHGKALMNRFRKEGIRRVENSILKDYKEMEELISRLTSH